MCLRTTLEFQAANTLLTSFIYKNSYYPEVTSVMGPLKSETLDLCRLNVFWCFLQLESYWTYEVCHGRYVRQYHEDREVSKTKTQEFFLGRWNKEAQEKLSECRQGPSTTAV